MTAEGSPRFARLRVGLVRLRRAFAALGALALVWLGGLIWYAGDVPRTVADTTTTTDAIVVLTGGAGRLDVGLRLLADERARKLLISGVPRDVDFASVLRAAGRDDALALRPRIELGHSAADTIGNAREAEAWMAREGFASLRLVTASYHMRRSLLEFRAALPQATIVPHPVFPQGFQAHDWWRWSGTLSLLVSEYTKYLAAAASLALGLRD